MVVACTRLLRGSGYVGFHGEVPEQPRHAALAAEYAHVTAPLRRLVDRYAGEICVALCAGTDVPDWVLEKLDELPDTMRESGRRAHQYENAVLDLVEAASCRHGSVRRSPPWSWRSTRRTTPAATSPCRSRRSRPPSRGLDALPLGEEVEVILATADPGTRKVEFRLD